MVEIDPFGGVEVVSKEKLLVANRSIVSSLTAKGDSLQLLLSFLSSLNLGVRLSTLATGLEISSAYSRN